MANIQTSFFLPTSFPILQPAWVLSLQENKLSLLDFSAFYCCRSQKNRRGKDLQVKIRIWKQILSWLEHLFIICIFSFKYANLFIFILLKLLHRGSVRVVFYTWRGLFVCGIPGAVRYVVIRQEFGKCIGLSGMHSSCCHHFSALHHPNFALANASQMGYCYFIH